ncbi:MAG: tyrosine-protein phosphatase [Blastocatellia bacterium]
MRVIETRFSTIAIVIALVSVASVAQTPGHKELPNFYKVNERIYRGGQPKAGGVKKLAELGIKTIINLRGADELTQAEEDEAKTAGLSYFNISMPGLSRPTHEQISRVMEIVGAQESGPVFIHCKRGSDRTGTVVAVYRISHDGWTADQALTEAKRFGLSWMEFGMKDYVADYYRDWNTGRQSSLDASSQSVKSSVQQ